MAAAGSAAVLEFGPRLALHESGDLREHRRGGGKQLGVQPGATRVPRAEILPAVAVRGGPKDFPLGGDGEIRVDR